MCGANTFDRTISALAARRKLTPNESFASGSEPQLVPALLKLSGVVLLCWEHKAIISDIIPLIPVGKGKPPTKWDGSRFDVVLRFDRAKGDDKFGYKELYPKLLSGDSDTPLG